MQQNIQQNIIRTFNHEQFRNNLIQWFYHEQRELPWRKDKDPYKVWVSEIMLQQTRVDTVIPYFNHFMDEFPSIEHLAKAEEERVLKAWEGLGYYSRARNLQSAVQEVFEEYEGKVPDNPKELSSLKGVGPYTTGAILSIAYDKPEPAVDGNVMRVMARLFSIWEDIAKPKTRKIFEEVVRETISKEDPSAFNQGLMELGAMVCTPKSPSCLLCPVQEHCRAFEEGVQHELPVKSKKKPPKELTMTALVLRNSKGEVLIHKRPSKGLLANLWEFPNHEMSATIDTQTNQLQRYMKTSYNIDVEVKEHLMDIKHVFSHIVWNIAVFIGETKDMVHDLQDTKFVKLDQLKDYAFPVSHQKIIKEITTNEK